MRHLLPALAALLLLGACSPGASPDAQAQPAIEDLERAPRVVEADRKWADVYEALDGTWRGTFKIYVDTRGQREGPRPTTFDPAKFEAEPYALQQVIDVEQVYTSESPYFQRVAIQDTYTDGNGQTRVARSKGVNKVQDGKLWCVVIKPDDTVIHTGTTDGEETLIWERDVRDPTRIEYFREEVKADTYTIHGYGYYGSDDPEKSPRLYFVGIYTRVK